MPYVGKAPVGGGFHKLDALTASATATYALTLGSAAYYPETANQLLVSLNGVIQAPQDSFTVSGSNLIFDSALTASDSIDFVVALGDVLGVGSVSDGAITTAKIGNGAVTDAKIDTMAASKLTGALPASVTSSGVYLGGTGAANYLDDYEEGTWTPSASSANGDAVVSTTIESATYTKVGNLVNVRCYITLTVTSVGTGNARITGLPFTNNGYYTPFTSTHETFAGSTGQGWVAPTSTRLEFLNANSTSTLSISGTGTKYAMISLTYKTDS